MRFTAEPAAVSVPREKIAKGSEMVRQHPPPPTPPPSYLPPRLVVTADLFNIAPVVSGDEEVQFSSVQDGVDALSQKFPQFQKSPLKRFHCSSD